MKKDILDFCESYLEYLQQKNNKSSEKTFFTLSKQEYYSYHSHSLFELDDEDLQYLYNKYSNRLTVELQENINSISSEYYKIINKQK